MRPTPDANANIVMTTNHFSPVPSTSFNSAVRAVTTPPPSAMFAARALPDTTPAPPTSTASEAGQPENRKIDATSATAAIW